MFKFEKKASNNYFDASSFFPRRINFKISRKGFPDKNTIVEFSLLFSFSFSLSSVNKEKEEIHS